MTPTLTPRSRKCAICKSVAKVEDVTVRLFGPDGERLPPKEAVEYLYSIGMTGTRQTIYRRINEHAKHVQRALANPPAVVEPGSMTPTAPVGGLPGWVSVTEQGIAVGMDALSLVASRMGDMEDRDLIAVAKIGQNAAAKWGDWEAKGRKLNQADAILKIASGFTQAPEQTE